MYSTASKLDSDTVIIRFGGEMGIKGPWTRRIYEHRLRQNIKSTLKRDKIVYNGFLRKRGRLYLKTSSVMEASSRLSKVFGVSSVSPALETTSRLDDVVSRSVSLAGISLKKGNVFAVRCKRVGNHPYKSHDICKEVGRRILAELPHLELRVNLESPDLTFGIDIRDEHAFIYSTTVYCAKGLPLGTQPKVICLLNGDVASPVACWLAMKRGCPIVPVYFDNTMLDGTTMGSTLEVAKALFDWAAGFSRKIFVVPNGQNISLFKEKCHERLLLILCKRFMYRISERLAEMEMAEGIVTGETIGEQASQTLRDLRVLNTVVHKYPVHRPLVGLDKDEIEELARKIGTYEISAKGTEDFAAVPQKLATFVNTEEITQAEAELNIEEMVEKSVESIKVVSLQ